MRIENKRDKPQPAALRRERMFMHVDVWRDLPVLQRGGPLLTVVEQVVGVDAVYECPVGPRHEQHGGEAIDGQLAAGDLSVQRPRAVCLQRLHTVHRASHSLV